MINVQKPLSTPPSWLAPAIRACGELLDLPENWDSYGAPPVDPDCVAAAMSLLLDVMQEDTPVPSVVPTSQGGVQIEWHTNGIDLEIEFPAPARLRGYFEDHESGDSWEQDLSFDQRPLAAAIARLSRQD